MSKETKWVVVVSQRYDTNSGMRTSVIAELTVKAKTAAEAKAKGDEWIKANEITDAFVDSAECRDFQRIDLTEARFNVISYSFTTAQMKELKLE